MSVFDEFGLLFLVFLVLYMFWSVSNLDKIFRLGQNEFPSAFFESHWYTASRYGRWIVVLSHFSMVILDFQVFLDFFFLFGENGGILIWKFVIPYFLSCKMIFKPLFLAFRSFRRELCDWNLKNCNTLTLFLKQFKSWGSFLIEKPLWATFGFAITSCGP